MKQLNQYNSAGTVEKTNDFTTFHNTHMKR